MSLFSLKTYFLSLLISLFPFSNLTTNKTPVAHVELKTLEFKTLTHETTKNAPKPVTQKSKLSGIDVNAILRNLASASTSPDGKRAQEFANFNKINSDAKKALVNIICMSDDPNLVHSVTGSGIFVSPQGVILTNAHIAQNFLLADAPHLGFMKCTIRTGSPAANAYKAKLLYLPPTWITANAKSINDLSPRGTGEDDYALLVVTSKMDGSPIITPVSYISPDLDLGFEPGTSVLEIAYPADFLNGNSITHELYSSSAVSEIEEIYSYDGVTKEFIALGGTVVAQHGSSGGAIINTQGKLMGLITSVTEESSTDKRELGAITMVHVDKSIRQSSVSLFEFLNSNAKNLADQFELKLRPALTHELVSAIRERP